jgi:hypothetical protein
MDLAAEFASEGFRAGGDSSAGGEGDGGGRGDGSRSAGGFTEVAGTGILGLACSNAVISAPDIHQCGY